MFTKMESYVCVVVTDISVAGHLCGSTAFKAGFVVGKENLSACRMADKAFVCACLEVLVAHIGCDCRSTVYQPSSGFKIIDGKKSRTRRRGGVRLYAVYVQRCVFPSRYQFLWQSCLLRAFCSEKKKESSMIVYQMLFLIL